ncbi:hypothetical protein DFH07DRAFT_778655 [Mycena maculata]|uniref:Uncharacterized protein n=1 Tax=Mycena maculata TaxID=230809 RepID=A0AAD7MZU5_9AGAR|nr:hypothetical protein DFH07DRAFT_778655 [Mycena maculata]
MSECEHASKAQKKARLFQDVPSGGTFSMPIVPEANTVQNVAQETPQRSYHTLNPFPPTNGTNLPPVYQSLVGYSPLGPSDYGSSPVPVSTPSIDAMDILHTLNTPNTVTDTTPTPTPTRLRSSKHSPIFGFVKGAYRGSDPLQIVRSREARKPLTSRSEVSHRFSKKTRELIERCEDLATETSCWLSFSAQHINANEAFFHYTSPRLLRDGKKDMEDIASNLNLLFFNLMKGRQNDALALTKRLATTTQELETTSQVLQEATKELDDTRNAMEQSRLNAEIQKANLEAQLEVYKKLLAGDGVDAVGSSSNS